MSTVQKVISINLQSNANEGLQKINNTLHEVDKTIGGAEKASQNLRTEFKQLQKDLLSGKFTGEEFTKATQRAGELKDEINDLNSRIKVLGSDTKNLDGLLSAAEGIAGGFAIAEGAAALFGDENEQLNQALLKVQASMAILQGIQSVANVLQKESSAAILINTAARKIYNFVMGTSTVATEANVIATETNIAVTEAQTVATVASTAATKAFRAALVATGIGAIIVALGMLANAMDLFGDKTEEATKAQEDFNAQISLREDMYKFDNDLINQNEKLALAAARKRGASEEEMTKIIIDSIKERLAEADEEVKKDEEYANRQLARNERFSKDFEKQSKDNLAKRKELRDQLEIAEANADADAAVKSRERLVKKNEEDKKERERIAKETEKAEQDRLSRLNDLYDTYVNDLRDFNAKTEQEKLDLQKQNDLNEINRITKNEEEKRNLLLLFNEKYAGLQADLDAKLAEQKIIKEDEQWLRLQELSMQKDEYDKLVLTQKYEAEYQAAAGNAELQKALLIQLHKDLANIDAIAAANKETQLQTDLGNLNKILAIGGKKTAGIAKALAIAEVVRNTIRSVNAATGNEIKVPAFIGTIPNPVKAPSMISTALGIGGAIANGVASIAAITNDSKSLGSAATAGGGDGGGASAPAPQAEFNIVGSSSNNQLAGTIAAQQNQPIQAFVVGSEVTTQQALDRNRVSNATFL